MNFIINCNDVIGIGMERVVVIGVHDKIVNIVDGHRSGASAISAIIINVLLTIVTPLPVTELTMGPVNSAADMASAMSAARLAGCTAASMTGCPVKPMTGCPFASRTADP